MRHSTFLAKRLLKRHTICLKASRSTFAEYTTEWLELLASCLFHFITKYCCYDAFHLKVLRSVGALTIFIHENVHKYKWINIFQTRSICLILKFLKFANSLQLSHHLISILQQQLQASQCTKRIEGVMERTYKLAWTSNNADAHKRSRAIHIYILMPVVARSAHMYIMLCEHN